MAINLDSEAKSKGLARRGRDLVLLPYKPLRYNPDSFPLKPTAAALTDAAEVGFTFWADAPGVGFTWVTDDRQRFHAVHSATRRGARQSQHACGRMRAALTAELDRLARAAWRELSWLERQDDGHREREMLRVQLALVNSLWVCETDGAAVEHPAVSHFAVEQLQIEVDA